MSEPWYKSQIFYILLSGAVSLCLSKYVMNSISSQLNEATEKRKNRALSRFARIMKDNEDKRNVLQTLDTHELTVLDHVILPNEIDVCMDDIGGLNEIRQRVHEIFSSISADQKDEMKTTKLNALPKGILLQGPPGTGKTMIAKAIAKEYSATFINVTSSLIYNYMLGETEKIIAAIFSLADKLAPSIIFIDEIDGLSRKRSAGYYESNTCLTAKTELMERWDGIKTSQKQVVILGATNRPTDIDEAILRRLSNKFTFTLPDEKDRHLIFERILKSERLADDTSIQELAQLTNKYSGSDIYEVCKCAAQNARRHQESAISKAHFKQALQIIPASAS